MRSGKHHSVVALLLLLVASAGMATSQPTGEMGELLGLHPDGVATVFLQQRTELHPPAGGVSNSKHQQQSGDQSTLDDDSLCWCAQMLSGSSFLHIFVPVKTSSSDSEGLTALSSPPRSFFHPPRFA